MEEFDDDDLSDLYADVVVQASTAISAMHRLRGMPPADDKISGDATGGEKYVSNRFNGAEIDGGNHKIYENGAECEDADGGQKEQEGGGGSGWGLANLRKDDGGISGSESEDDMDSGGDDGYRQNFDDNSDDCKYDNSVSDCEFGVRNSGKREGGERIEGDEKKHGVIDRNEKSVNGGDSNCQRKSLKYNSSSSKKMKVDEMACLCKSCKEEDADLGDRELCFGREIEDNQPDIERRYGGPNNASERPLYLNVCRSVQISDSVEDNHCEVSDFDSDGMTEATETYDDMNRRKTSSMSNKLSSAVEPESSESGWSQHGRGPSFSPSPRVAPRDKYIGKSHNFSKYHSSSLACELQDEFTREYCPSRDSKSHGDKRGTRYGRYCERQRNFTRKHSNLQKKYNNMPYLKTHWTNEDASYAIDVKHHGKKRAILGFESNGNFMPYCRQSEGNCSHSDGFFPDHRLGPSYLKNQYLNTHPSCRYKEGWPDGHNMSKRQSFLEKKSSKINYEALGGDWYHNRRRHPIQGNIEGLRKLRPKYSSSAVNQRGSQFICEGSDVHFRRRTKDDYTRADYLSPLHESHNKFVEGKYRRTCPSSGRYRDHLDHRYDRNIARDRREVESSGRGKRRRDSPDNLWYSGTAVNDRGNIKHRPFPFYSSEEPCAPSRGQFPGASRPKSRVLERNTRCSWKELQIENGRYGTNIITSDTRESLRYHHSEDPHVRRRHYQQSSNTYITDENIKDDRDEDHFIRGRDHRYSEVFQLREEVYKSWQQDATIFLSEEPSYHFKTISRIDRTDDRHAFGRVADLIVEREADRQRSKAMRGEDFSRQFDECHKSVQPHGHAQMHPRYQDSVDGLVDVGRKCTMQSPRRTSEAGDDKYYGRHYLAGRNDNQISKNFEDSDEFHSEKAVLTNEEKVDIGFGDKNQPSKFCEIQQNEFLDIEEGQIITEEIQELVKRAHTSEDESQINDKGHPETASDGNGVVLGLDDQKIQEIMVKMERRRERFKEPIMTSRDCEKTSILLPDLDVQTAEAKLERPVRKRRWSGT